ncbi:MAG: VOC family protein [Oscillospiraceae bacterium]|nr:VOC family protein [Oscillospiraceae bacterium]
MSMQFTDVCFITNDVLRLRAFYEAVFGVKAEGDEIHSFVHVEGLGIAIYNKDKATNENPEKDYHSTGNDCFYIGFNCDNADIEYQRIHSLGICSPSKPTLWPWGAKSFSFRDPDGNNIVIRSWPKEG